MIVFPQITASNEEVVATIAGADYTFRFRWNDRNSSWYLDVDDARKAAVARGIRIVLGGYLGRRVDHQLFRDGVLVALDTSGRRAEAGYGDLGVRVQLRYYEIREAALLKSGASTGSL